ncbi:hypothetical protein Pcinc_002762 [Petrolisthes cinctipes]|uniref:AB hydrolase-1 domain-containing protein n=1 Tax=Petrolisthes cinctipes TaxID=88211 RepID=A0AAE1L2N7_PETCI|nr:hypothetical protein Pcinc_002762 [Petrolisthes cinctipes]
MRCSSRIRRRNRFVRPVVVGAAVVLVSVWVVVPVVYRASPSLQRFFIFLNKVGNDVNLSRPENLGLPGTRSFHLNTDDDVTVGVWHILPESLINSAPEEDPTDRDTWFEASLADTRPIVLYLHGNKGSRGQPHRIDTYTMLRRQDYHVIAFDYRGYADSSPVTPSETGLVADTKAMLAYLQSKAGRSPIIVWGHSLGTGVSCHAVADVCGQLRCPQALILEAPFNNIRDEVKLNPLSQLFHYLPYFDWAFVQPLKSIDAEFKSDAHIPKVTCPILILHAQDDNVVPVQLGRKLERAARRGRPPEAGVVKFVEVDGKLGLGHNHINHSPLVPALVREFIDKAVSDTRTRNF